MKVAKYIFAAMFILSIVSCAKQVNDMNKPQYTGEALFRGIFFFQGDIPSKISSFSRIKEGLDKMGPLKKIEEDNFIDKMVQKVKIMNPNYFEELSAAVESKDNYAIDESMKTGAKLIQVALANTDEYKAYLNIPNDAFASIDFSKYNLSKQTDLNALLLDISGKLKAFSKTENGTNLVCVVVVVVVALAVWDALAVVNYGAVVNAAALAIVYAAVYAKVVFWGVAQPSDGNGVSLERELIIKDISNLNIPIGKN